MRLCSALYARAEVEDAVDSDRICWRGALIALEAAGRIALVERARMAFLDAMIRRYQ